MARNYFRLKRSKTIWYQRYIYKGGGPM
jgi:hypothetical protein